MKIRYVLISFFLFTIVVGWPGAVSADSQAVSDETEYFAVFLQGKKVGYTIQDRVVEDDKVTTSINTKMTVIRFGVSVSFKIKASTFETIDGKPLGFELEQVFGTVATKTIGSIDERGRVITRTGRQKTEFDWPNGAVMPEGMRLIHLKHGLMEGTAYDVKVFDPSMMRFFDVEVKVGSKRNVDLLGRILSLTEVQSNVSSEQIQLFKITEYYDDELRLQKSITPTMGMIIEQVACTKEFALGGNDVLDIINNMFLTSPVPLEDVGSAESITYHIRKIGEAKLMFPSTDNQKVRQAGDGNVVVTVKPVDAPTGVTFPYRGDDKTALAALKPTRYVQSDHKSIIKLARRAVGDSKDAAEAAGKIEAFVGDYVENRSLSVGYATAEEVADSRQGDCTEFSVLTAAMCRAVGIPARVIVGVAYVKEYAGLENQFGGHMWTEAYLGNKWIGLDASFKGAGRGGYDAGHITLSIGNGNPEDFFKLVTTMGQFKIENILVNNQ
jgi:hypothetical protein